MAACGRCGNRAGHDPIAEAQCELLSVLRRGAVAASARLDQPAAEVAVLDLFAHLKTIYEDGTLAYRAAVKVLELGWRPVVGGFMAEMVLCEFCELGMPRGQLFDHWCDGRLAAAERGRRLIMEGRGGGSEVVSDLTDEDFDCGPECGWLTEPGDIRNGCTLPAGHSGSHDGARSGGGVDV